MSDKKLSFKDFIKNSDEQINEVILPAHTVDKDGTGAEETEEVMNNIPALFATIHFKSEHRPDGYTEEDMIRMNNAANAHLPHLQQPIPGESKD